MTHPFTTLLTLTSDRTKEQGTWWKCFYFENLVISRPCQETDLSYLKGLSVVIHSKVHFFFFFFSSIFCIFRENSAAITYPHINSLRKQHVFGKRDNFYCWKLIITGDTWIKPVFLVRNHLNLDFFEVLM